MGADGWLGIGWPKEFGGQGRSAIEQYIFFDEVQRAGFPIPFLTLCTVGPTLMKYGTDEQKAKFLPAILRGELHFAIGYSEPGAGTDLAALRTRAVRDGDDYVVDGQKVFTSLAEYADYIWLAVRTDPEAPAPQGHLDPRWSTRRRRASPLSPIHTLGDNRTNATFYEGVRVPVSARVGRENEGWKLITTQLNHERVALSSPGPGRSLRRGDDRLGARDADGRAASASSTSRGCRRTSRGRGRTCGYCGFSRGGRHGTSTREGSTPPSRRRVKVFGSESFIRIYGWLLEVLGQEGYLKDGSPGARLRGRDRALLPDVDRAHLRRRHERSAARHHRRPAGLGMPRARRVRDRPMDFSFTEAQSAVAGLARRIFDERLGAAAMKAVEAGPDRFDRATWARARVVGLLGTAIPEAHGGIGHGLLEVCALLEEAGAAVAPLPLWETLVLGA